MWPDLDFAATYAARQYLARKSRAMLTAADHAAAGYPLGQPSAGDPGPEPPPAVQPARLAEHGVVQSRPVVRPVDLPPVVQVDGPLRQQPRDPVAAQRQAVMDQGYAAAVSDLYDGRHEE